MELVTEGLRFPEGPVAMPDGSVVLVEIERGCVTRVLPDGSQQVIAELGGGPNGAAIGPDGRLYVCNNGGFDYIERAGLLVPHGQASDYSGGRIERVDLETGAVETLYRDGDFGCTLRGPNDIVFDDAGGFWFTDHGKTRERERDVTGVFYAKADGSLLKEVIFPMENPNGIGLSPDGKRLYVAETYTCKLWAYDVAGPGEIAFSQGLLGPSGTFLYSPPGYTFSICWRSMVRAMSASRRSGRAASRWFRPTANLSNSSRPTIRSPPTSALAGPTSRPRGSRCRAPGGW